MAAKTPRLLLIIFNDKGVVHSEPAGMIGIIFVSASSSAKVHVILLIESVLEHTIIY